MCIRDRHLAAEDLNSGLPAALNPSTWAAYLTSVTFIVTLMSFPEGSAGGRKVGLFLALIFSAIATVLTVIHWREEGK